MRRVITFFVLLGTIPVARADVVILKDGYTLHGELQKEKSYVTDPLTGLSVPVAKLGGFSLVVDGPRSVIFSPHSQRVGDVDPADIRGDFIKLTRPRLRGTQKLDPHSYFENPPPKWDDKWARVVRANLPSGGYTNVNQRIVTLTPYYAEIESSTHVWKAFMLTAEMGRDVVRPLLNTYPDWREEEGEVNVGARKDRFRFYTQAGWYDLAHEELERMLKDKPDEKEWVEEGRKRLRTLATDKLLDEIEIARKAGRFEAAKQHMSQFPPEELDGPFALRYTAFKSLFDEDDSRFDGVTRFLTELPKEVTDEEEQFLVTAAAMIADSVRVNSASRLDLFTGLARQAEEDRKNGREPSQTPAQLLALALTGWFQGGNLAIADVQAARKAWDGYQFIRAYLSVNGPGERDALFTEYQQREVKLTLEEMADLIRNMPPIEPDEGVNSPQPLQRTTASVSGSRPGGVEYLLQLPPEYHHGRVYPVLIVLHHRGQEPEQILSMYAPWAARHGYILAAPKWLSLFNAGEVGHEERLTVRMTLRDLRNRLNVDSDRVFLSGWGAGASLAFEIGLGQPDLFAGVIPIGANPDWSGLVIEYWRNAQYLPFYVVTGNFVAEAAKNVRRIFGEWAPKGFPSLGVVYFGRGFEWFPAELPNIFDWMDRQQRLDPLQIGKTIPGFRGLEFRTVRRSDDRFYWLSTDSIKTPYLKAETSKLTPAVLTGSSRGNNVIEFTSRGLNNLTIWLSPELVDFSRDTFTLRVSDRGTWKMFERPLKADMGVLLDDFRRRGDRQRLFFAKVELR